MLPLLFYYNERMFDDFADYSKRLRLKIEFYIASDNFERMIRFIEQGNYCWRNYSIMEGIPEGNRALLASRARFLLLSLLRARGISKSYLAYLYCLCHYSRPIVAGQDGPSEVVWFSRYNLDLTALTGDVKMEPDGFMVMGSRVSSYQPKHLEASLPILLPGYRYLPENNETCLVLSLKRARELGERMPEGSMIKISLLGSDRVFIRDSSHASRVADTISKRVIAETPGEYLLDLIKSSSELIDSADLSMIPIKRLKESDAQEAIDGANYDDDEVMPDIL